MKKEVRNQRSEVRGWRSVIIRSFIFCFLFSVFCNLSSVCIAQEEQKKQTQAKQLVVYTDQGSEDNHYYPTQRIGDGDALQFDDGWPENPRSGNTCIKIQYKATGNFGFAGIYWVNPKANWGDQKGGYDLRFASKLTFWVRGEKGGEHIAVFKFGGFKGIYPDSDNHGIGPMVLTKEWQKISVDVSTRNMRYISAGFSFAIAKAYNRKGCIFYIDDIKYE